MGFSRKLKSEPGYSTAARVLKENIMKLVFEQIIFKGKSINQFKIIIQNS